MKMFATTCILSLCILSYSCCFGQYFTRTDTIPVKINSTLLKSPWVGGHNFCQFSDIDMNFDGIKDLFVFDRTGFKITCYINKGTPNTVDYIDSTLKFRSHFPHLEDWALLRDYNCDGNQDIFTYGYGSIRVFKNTSSGNSLQFTLVTSGLKSTYCPPSLLNLAVTGVDIPTIDDIDGDGDLDILTYDAGGINIQYHVNKSKELGYNCDSLIFNMDCSGCWGNFRNNISGCNIVYGTCATPGPDSLSAQRGEKHAGNCTVCMDLDADGDKEVLIGQLGCCNMVMLTNGGSAAVANMIAMDDSFPTTNLPASFNSFPCGYFVDVNNDNKRDLIVSPNAPNVSLNKESIWFYLNTGADNAPVFGRQTRSLLQQDMIDIGEGATPVFFDFTNDGLTDLLLSGYTAILDSCPSTNNYGVRAYKNTGTLNSPAFELASNDFAALTTHLVGVGSKHPTFGDLDGDGDKDMCVGEFDGFVHYFQNIATTSNPANFSYVSPIIDLSTGNPLDIGGYSTPQLIDIDRDNDLDLIVGERSGNLNYYQNTGSASTHAFTFVTSSFGGVDVLKSNVTGYSVPFIYDSLGSYKMIVGSEASKANANKMGWLWKFKDIDGNLAGNFTLVDSMFQNIWEGPRMALHGTDINNDGSLDLAIGNYSGGVSIYLGDTSAVSVNEHLPPAFDCSLHPNPSTGIMSLQCLTKDASQGTPSIAEVFNPLGQQVLEVRLNEGQATNELDLTGLAPGIYSCRISTLSCPSCAGITKKLVIVKQ